MADGTTSKKKSTVRGRARKRGITPKGLSRKRAVNVTQKSYDAGNFRAKNSPRAKAKRTLNKK